MKYASVCSGIEAASVAWEPLGWRPAWFSEIEPFPCAVLAHRFPNVPNMGDMTKIKGDEHGAIDLLVGGTPCQDLSIAGKRMGFGGKRSVLALDFVRLAYESGAKFFAWENVPGVFSSNGGEDFAQLLSLFAGWQVDTPSDGWGRFGIVEQSPGCFGLAWRIIDVQYARVDGFPNAIPQRRNRVFVVGYLGDWRRAAQVLFEPEGLLGNTPPRREAGKGVAEGAERGVAAGRPWDETGVNPSLCRGGLGGIGASNQELFSQDANGLVFDARGNGDGVAYTLDTPTLNCNHEAPILALAGNTIGRKPDNGGNGCGYKEDVSYTLTKTDEHGIMQGSSVRRLTPIECERLMGFPANWTRIPWRGKPAEDCPDGPRYKACGNSMGVNVMRWIGTRIQEVEDIHKKSNRANTACISAGEVL